MYGIKTKLLRWAAKRRVEQLLPADLKRPMTLEQLRAANLSRMQAYAYCNYYFDRHLPADVKEHRHFFSLDQRGFGENAFHAMWYLLFQSFRPAKALEIGVYRGQTITLWKLLARHFKFDCQIGAVSPFTPSGDTCSVYDPKVNYFEDTIRNHEHFKLSLPSFCKEFSTSSAAEDFITRSTWQLIYIDGNHDYEIVKHDWQICSAAIAANGIIVLDDAALNTDFEPPVFSSAGHPGPSRIAAEIDQRKFKEIFSVGHNRVFQRNS